MFIKGGRREDGLQRGGAIVRNDHSEGGANLRGGRSGAGSPCLEASPAETLLEYLTIY